MLFHRGLASLSKDDMLERTRRRRRRRTPDAEVDDEYDDDLCSEDEGPLAGCCGDTRAIYLQLFYQPGRFRFLELAPCQRVADTVLILDALLLLLLFSDEEEEQEQQLGQQHEVITLKIKLFASASMSLEESYLVKRLLRWEITI